jgi:hypothetical protein
VDDFQTMAEKAQGSAEASGKLVNRGALADLAEFFCEPILAIGEAG